MNDDHWASMFEPRSGRGAGRMPAGVPPAPPINRDEPDAENLAIDMTEYRPWALQRVRSRPAMMLHLRRYEPKSGLWMGWAVSYAHLAAVEYVGDRMLSLDFGARQFLVQGHGLDQLIDPLQEGAVLALREYSASVWPELPQTPIIQSLQSLGRSVTEV